MNYKRVGRILSQILAIEALFMIPALIISIIDMDLRVVHAYILTMLIIIAVSFLLALLSRNSKRGFYAREGLVCVGLGWLMMSLMGCLPFCISGQIPHFIDAFFEIVSGFTTTGSTILSDVEALSRGLLYWRSFSHWLGGMGVLVFLLAIASSKKNENASSLHILRAESPGPNVGKLVPRMRQTAMILYILYIVLTVLDFIFLVAGGMPWFDSLCTAFGTAGTGGFGIKNDSMASYSPYLQTVCTVFMLLFGVNFNVYYWIIFRQFKNILKNEELRFYILVIVISTGVITWNILSLFDGVGQALHHAAFQVASIITTTGFSTVNFDLWPGLSKGIMLTLMICGACAGSTGGGIKCSRIVILLKSIKRSIKRILHPQQVSTIHCDGQPIPEKVVSGVGDYLILYVFIIICSFLIVSIDGFSIETNISAVISCFNNIGPGFDAVNAFSNFSGYSVLSKLVLIFDMLAGRLELYPIIILFARRTWRTR